MLDDHFSRLEIFNVEINSVKRPSRSVYSLSSTKAYVILVAVIGICRLSFEPCREIRCKVFHGSVWHEDKEPVNVVMVDEDCNVMANGKVD